MRVLVVDDDPAMLKLITRHVLAGGYEVVEARDGAEALRLIQEEGIPLIVTDWVMPEMDGLDLCRHIRSAEGVEIAFVIVMSAYNTSEARLVEAFEAGVDDFLAKPVSEKELLARLRAGCRIVRLQQDLARRNREVHRINAESAITNDKLAEANERLRVVATIDELTGLVNRRAAIERLNTYWAHANRDGGALSCVMLDIDHFKSFNDVHGHAIGDLVLKEVGRVLCEQTRRGEDCCRIGGEEFLVLCPGASEEEAVGAAERLRDVIESHRIVAPDVELAVTVSVGVAQRTTEMDRPDDLMRAADTALYAAKDRGRNIVVAAGDVDTSPVGEADTASVPSEEASIDSPGHGESGCALVVDDEKASRVLTRRFLEQAGYLVEEAVNGRDALEMVERVRPDVIVMDVMMPEMDGLECVRRLKADPATECIPVVIASGRADATDAMAAHDAGAAEFIGKPVNAKELVLRVRSVTRYQRQLDDSNAVRGEQARALGLLLDYSHSIAGTDSLEAILDSTIRGIAELTNCRRISLMLPDRKGNRLTIARSIGLDESLVASISVPFGAAIAGRVYESGVGVVANTAEDQDLGMRADDSGFFVSVPLVSKALHTSREVIGVLNVTDRQGGEPFREVELEYIDLLCNIAASAIHDCLTQQARDEAHDSIVVALATLAEYRDSDTGQHLERVTEYCIALATELRSMGLHTELLTDEYFGNLRRAVPLHDIGKVGVPDHVLKKPGRLTPQEMDIIRTHADIGADTIRSVIDHAEGVKFLSMAEQIARSHHEWFNGDGYPRGISGTDIPLAARITAVADVYDALTTKRVYKDAVGHDASAIIIRELAGTQFDPDVIEAFDRCEERFIQLAQSLRDAQTEAGGSPDGCRDAPSVDVLAVSGVGAGADSG